MVQNIKGRYFVLTGTSCIRSHGILLLFAETGGTELTCKNAHFRTMARFLAESFHQNDLSDLFMFEFFQTDDARTHISCAAYTAPTLACIAEGVDIIPPQPQELRADQVMDTKFILR